MEEKDYDVFLINSEGEKISSDEIDFHLGLAKLVLKENPKLKEEYEQSKRLDEFNFLLIDKGYIAGFTSGNEYKRITYYSKTISKKQKKVIEHYHKEGAKISDLAEEEQKMERGEI